MVYTVEETTVLKMNTEASATESSTSDEIFNSPERWSPGKVRPVLAVVYISVALFGIAGNSMVLAVVARSSTIKKRISSYYVLSQSSIDLFASVVLFFRTIFVIEVTSLQTGLAGELRCILWETDIFMWIAFHTSTFNLVAITIEMYIEVVFPIKHKTLNNRKRIYVTIAVIVMLSATLYLSVNISTSDVVDGQCIRQRLWPRAELRQGVGVMLVSVHFLAPLMVFIFVYLHIAYTLHLRARPRVAAAAAQPHPQQQPKTADELRAAKRARARNSVIKTFLLIAVTYVLCWVTNQTLYLKGLLGYGLDRDGALYHTSVALAFLDIAVNPVIYITKYELFRIEFKKQFCGAKDAVTSTITDTT